MEQFLADDVDSEVTTGTERWTKWFASENVFNTDCFWNWES